MQCWIDVFEKEKDTIDPIELYREKIKDRKRKELDLSKLLGDAKSLEEEIDEYTRKINENKKELNMLENIIDMKQLAPKDKQKLKNVQEQIYYTKYKTDKVKQELYSVKGEILHSTATIEEISKLQFEFQKIKNYADNLMTSTKLKTFTLGIDIIGLLSQPDAAELWDISVDGHSKIINLLILKEKFIIPLTI